jgi:hypothetical protein
MHLISQSVVLMNNWERFVKICTKLQKVILKIVSIATKKMVSTRIKNQRRDVCARVNLTQSSSSSSEGAKDNLAGSVCAGRASQRKRGQIF